MIVECGGCYIDSFGWNSRNAESCSASRRDMTGFYAHEGAANKPEELLIAGPCRSLRPIVHIHLTERSTTCFPSQVLQPTGHIGVEVKGGRNPKSSSQKKRVFCMTQPHAELCRHPKNCNRSWPLRTPIKAVHDKASMGSESILFQSKFGSLSHYWASQILLFVHLGTGENTTSC